MLSILNRSRSRASRRPRQRRRGNRGLSLTEVMVSGVLGSVIVTSVTTMNNVSNRTMRESNVREGTEVAIERDLETIRNRVNSYTWCSGAGTLAPIADRNRCRTTNRSNKWYYSPKAEQDEALFESACNDNRATTSNLLLANLITNISPPTLPNPQGATRTVSVSDGTTKRLQITYSGTSGQRTVQMTPNVAAWCS